MRLLFILSLFGLTIMSAALPVSPSEQTPDPSSSDTVEERAPPARQKKPAVNPRPQSPTQASASNQIKVYAAFHKQVTDDKATIDDISKFLNGVRAEPRFINILKDRNGKVMAWGGIKLTAEGLKKVQARPEFQAVLEQPKLVRNLRPVERPAGKTKSMPKTGDPAKKKNLMKRVTNPRLIPNKEYQLQTGKKVQWYKDLVMHSMPPVRSRPSKDYNSYVFPGAAGQGSFVYHVGTDIDGGTGNGFPGSFEFPEHRMEIHLTALAEKDYSGGLDDAKDHDTCVASKAVGTRFGVAKEAKLVSVVIAEELDDYIAGFQKAADVLFNRPPADRMKSVVFTSTVVDNTMYPAAAQRLWEAALAEPLMALHNMGIPTVFGSGNDDSNQMGPPIQVPVIQESANLPIIVAGACDFEGRRSVFSRGPAHVTVYAPGQDLYCQGTSEWPDEDRPMRNGTSLAAPQVAGVLALYMSEPNQPWGSAFNTGLDRVRAIKRFIQVSSAYRRAPEQDAPSVLWNGVFEPDHANAQPFPGWPTN